MAIKNSKRLDENFCVYCLHFQVYPDSKTALQGNCTLHKEWIENAGRTTCGEMSAVPLKEPGIYHLKGEPNHGWIYVKREKRVRTKLFVVRKPHA
jgi:hypothetical protein